ncbi:MAG: hypothetical protein OXD32_04500 [Endozoicomonadaceae bacterium]|nr:hypothetical protein [Endozoicomonadaceae bacterium]
MSDAKSQSQLKQMLEQLAKHWNITSEVVDNLIILPIPYKGDNYSVCFSVLDENFALMVLQASSNIADANNKKLLEILKRNSIINSALSVFFIHESDDNKTDELPLLYQALFPYSQLPLSDCIQYVESYLEQYSDNMKRIENVGPSTGRKSMKSTMDSKSMGGLKI